MPARPARCVTCRTCRRRGRSFTGRQAGELALKLIDDPEGEQGRHVVLPTRVIPRATTAPVARGRDEGERDGEPGTTG